MIKQPDILIVAAGKGSRMGDVSIPKALADVGGQPNLINTIDTLKFSVDKIYVAISSIQEAQFRKCLDDHDMSHDAILIVIPSGLGSGHATLSALARIDRCRKNQLIITWGDVYFDDDELILELTEVGSTMLESRTTDLIIPCAFEQHPYLTVSVDENMNAKGVVLEPTTPGFHDQSVFLCTCVAEFYNTLNDMHHALWNVDHYITVNGEFGFLQIVPFMWNRSRAAKIYETDHTLMGYNTKEELAKIIATK